MKKFISIVLSMFMLFSLCIPATATEVDTLYVNESDIEVVADNALIGNRLSSEEAELRPIFINDFRYRKVNVSTSYDWSPYKRVSDNLITSDAGGELSSTKSVTFGTEVTGSISSLGISTSASLTSEIGYTLNVGANKRVYMGYRVRYEIETGTRECYDIVTGKVIDHNDYTVKTPIYGEYKLINYSD